MGNYLYNTQTTDKETMNREEIIKLIDERIKHHENKNNKNEISIEAIEEYIESQIIKSSSNLQFVPDPLERKVYLNVCKTVMESLKTMFNTTSIDVLNHRITFNITPITKSKQ